MSPYVAEFVGTMILVLLGNGVCANVNLTKTLGNDSGWIVIATGWGLAVAFAVYLVNAHSGAHLNPAVTIGLAVIGEFAWTEVGGYVWTEIGGYIAAQMVGAIAGATLVWLTYLPHWKATENPGNIRGCFCTAPAIPHTVGNLITEIIGTFVLMLGVLAILTPENLVPNTGFDKGFAPALVGLMVWSIGLSIGGPTGYAINPARDLGPRIAHAILPIAGKGDSGWNYSWIPVAGPIIGGVIGALFYQAVWPVS
ncbi:MAG: aquaporin family protein [Fuerstiella sp.]|nr:aquaporin family protein [Fuerstiella sp.]MCP4853396.1 aquaporin family protein [Fuerstiella sp.]